MIRTVICDDEPATIRIIQHFLKEEHLPIEIVGIAEDGKEALQLIQTTNPKLIFMDINMPELSGFEVLDHLHQKKEMKVIILTAFDSFTNAQRALRLGVCDILPKPLDLLQLRESINRVVGWNFTSNETVNMLLEYIHEHYTEEIDLEELASLTFCTCSHLSRLFKKHMKTTILSYIHELRIKQAKEMLLQPNANIQQVAESIGYASLNNFYKYFKRHTGITPAQYIEERGAV